MKATADGGLVKKKKKIEKRSIHAFEISEFYTPKRDVSMILYDFIREIEIVDKLYKRRAFLSRRIMA